MPRSNISDEDGHSLTSDDDEFGVSAPAEGRVPLNQPMDNMNEPPPRAHNSVLRYATGLERFRAAGRAVIRMRTATRGAGGEPGVDVRSPAFAMLYAHLRDDCQVEVIDYCDTQVSIKVLENAAFKRWINGQEFPKKPWVKVRWINVAGLSWEIIRELGLKYSLHPLALEDLLHDRKLSRSKADYYSKHLFLRAVCHELDTDSNEPADGHKDVTEKKRSASPSRMSTDTKTGDYEARPSNASAKVTKRASRMTDIEAAPAAPPPTPLTSPSRASSFTLNEDAKEHEVERLTLQKLKESDRINIVLRNMFIFLTREDTVISIRRTRDLQFTKAISMRLRQTETNLRANPDASMLIHALLDLIVDKAIEVMNAYHDKIVSLEKITLLRPKMSTVKALHILSGDLILHKRTMEPLKQLVYGLRRYDLDRCVALAQGLGADTSSVKGYMSHKSKVYLADVVDHVENILSSMDMFSAIAENLVDYTFNLNSAETNETMRRLTIVTVLCLPMTLLTGYFGMNFEDFPAVINGGSIVYFWKIAIPVAIGALLATTWTDVTRVFKYAQRRLVERRVRTTVFKYRSKR